MRLAGFTTIRPALSFRSIAPDGLVGAKEPAYLPGAELIS